MRTLILAASAATALASPALAQDWSGPYVSGVIGYAASDTDSGETLVFDTDQNGSYGDTVRTSSNADAFSPGFCDGTATGPTPGAGCTDDDDAGLDIGLRAGYDWQRGNFVFGVLGEISRADVQDAVSGFSTTPARYTMDREINLVAAVRARVGVSTGAMLIYGTAGLARGDIDRSFSTSNGANSFTERDNDMVNGRQFGGGIEWAYSDRMSIGAEYLWTSLDDDEYTVRAGPGTAPATNPFLIVTPSGTDIRRSNDQFEFGSLRLTATYRF